jgi:hypothetical protein
MSKKIAYICLGVFLAVAAVNVRAKADSVPWGYSANNAEIFNNNNALGTSSAKFNGASGVATGSSGIIIYSLAATSSTGSASPDSFANVPFNLSFTVSDILATGSKSASAVASDVVNVAGLFSASNVTKNSLLPGASPWSSPVTANVVLGADDVGWRNYSILLSSFTSPGQPGGSPGSIQAIVRITSVNGPSPGDPGTPPQNPGGSGESPTPAAAPEPATLVLAGFGILPLLALWRKRRSAATI